MSAPDFSDLPPAERAKRCRVLAEDARREAAMAKGSLRETYILIAMQWERLAAEAEANNR